MIFVYLNKQTGLIERFPVTLDDLKVDYPFISFVGDIGPDSVLEIISPHVKNYIVAKVYEVDPPALKPFAYLKQVNPVFRGNIWRQQWVQVDVGLEEAQVSAITQIEEAADGARKAAIGNDTNSLEYVKTAEEAKAYKDAGYIGEAGPTVATWARIKGWTLQEAAENILHESDKYYSLLYAIRDARLSAKERIRNALSVDDVRAVFGPTMQVLAMLTEQGRAANAA